MKFDFVIGNPPYQDETVGDQKNFAAPVYNFFMDCAFELADKVELITPARFLFNAGGTKKEWNLKMLSDPHFKVLQYFVKSNVIFSNTDIKGGVIISLHDVLEDFGAIGIFTTFEELNSIISKTRSYTERDNFSQIVVSRTAYRLTDVLHEEHPEAIKRLSNGHAHDMSTNIFDRLSDVFYDNEPRDGYEYIRILGREGNERVYKYIRRDYVNHVPNLDKYKVFVPKSNGSGALGEVLSTPVIGQPVIGQPVIGHTETFISIGSFDTNEEAQACYKYVCSKFCRVMLGILKCTPDNPPEKWKYVPLQDFTPSSDIDWTKSIEEIDQQLYKKYELSKEEIDFIETHVKEMA